MFTYNSFTDGLFIFKESTIKVAGKAGKKPDKAKSDKPSTAKSGQKSEKKVRIKYKVKRATTTGSGYVSLLWLFINLAFYFICVLVD